MNVIREEGRNRADYCVRIIGMRSGIARKVKV